VGGANKGGQIETHGTQEEGEGGSEVNTVAARTRR